jgi:hypothetical protein
MAHQFHPANGAAPGKPRLGRGLLGYLGMRSRSSHGVRDGTQHGQPNEYQDGAHEGAQHGSSNAVHRRITNGISDEPSHGKQHGTRHGHHQGQPSGASHGSAIEDALGLEFHIVDGVVLACEPGHVPAPGAVEHAWAFLRWLQRQDHFPGNEVPARLLEDALYPLFCSAAGWEPYAWRTVAGRFRRLPGVRRRQVDRRTGDDRTGYMPVVYKIPRAKH